MLNLHALRVLLSSAALTVLATSCTISRPEDINAAYREVLDQRFNHYVLKPGDAISVTLYNRQTDLNQRDLLILPDGRSDLFFMDNHSFVGKTVSEVEAELRAQTAGEIQNVAEVMIQVRPKEEVAYFIGQFERPGTVPLTTKMTLHEAISSVGGTNILGDTDYALLRRPYKDPRHPELFRIDLNDEVEELFLLPGDQVILGRTFLAGLIGYLREYVFGIIPGGSPLQNFGLAGAAAL